MREEFGGMLLWMSRGVERRFDERVCWCCWRGEDPVHLAGDGSFQAADDFFLGESFRGAALDVGAGWRVVSHPGQSDGVQGVVGCPVTATVEPVTVALA